MTENALAWEKVFGRLPIVASLREHGTCYLTADQLKEHGQREPRLMAKMDTLQERPPLFAEHQVNIFPVRNGQYVLVHDPENKTFFQLAHALENIRAREYFSPDAVRRLETFPRHKQFSESQAIDFAFAASLLRTFFDDATAQLTIRGRLFSDAFTFNGPSGVEPIEVSKVQIELDAGFEGEHKIFIVEAKIGKRDHFNIRQLYYPYLNWSGRSRKKVVPIFLTFTNDQYILTEFAFSPIFGNLKIVRNECYTINDSPTARIHWPTLLRETPAETELTPFPQADDLDKVVDIIRLVETGLNDKAQLAEFFEFEPRQGDYYANAAIYLGYLTRNTKAFQLTGLGKQFNALSARAERTIHLVGQLLKRPSFHRIIDLLANRNFLLAALAEDELAQIIQQCTGLNHTTSRRRASTARAWIMWLMKNSQPIFD
jgi:hypothetical protein